MLWYGGWWDQQSNQLDCYELMEGILTFYFKSLPKWKFDYAIGFLRKLSNQNLDTKSHSITLNQTKPNTPLD